MGRLLNGRYSRAESCGEEKILCLCKEPKCNRLSYSLITVLT